MTWKLDRLGRSLNHLIEIVTQLEQQHMNCVKNQAARRISN